MNRVLECVVLAGLLLAGGMAPARADESSGVNCNGTLPTSSNDGKVGTQSMSDVCDEWSDALDAASDGSSNPGSGGSTTGGTGPNGPEPVKPAKRDPTLSLTPAQVAAVLARGSPPASSPAPGVPSPTTPAATVGQKGISRATFVRRCVAYQSAFQQATAKSAQDSCTTMADQYGLSRATPAAASTPPFIALAVDRTHRHVVGSTERNAYSVAVSPGRTYVASLSGVIGEVDLALFDDAMLKRPTACLAKNLSNTSGYEPVDCSFTAQGGSIYAVVKPTRHRAGGGYSIRVSPRNEAAAMAEGQEKSPVAVANDAPYAGTAGPADGDVSFYTISTRALGGNVVVSMSGLAGRERLDMSIYTDAAFHTRVATRDNFRCWLAQAESFPESCLLPAGHDYWIKVTTRGDESGGPFTLMVDSSPSASGTATASPAPGAAGVGNPASTTIN